MSPRPVVRAGLVLLSAARGTTQLLAGQRSPKTAGCRFKSLSPTAERRVSDDARHGLREST